MMPANVMAEGFNDIGRPALRIELSAVFIADRAVERFGAGQAKTKDWFFCHARQWEMQVCSRNIACARSSVISPGAGMKVKTDQSQSRQYHLTTSCQARRSTVRWSRVR